MTFLSRIMGLIRDVVIAIVFGATGATDAFFVAFRIPNLLRRLFAEGAFSLAFVPVVSQYRETRSPEALKDLVDHVAGMLSLILFVVTLIGVLAAPLLILAFAPGFAADDGRLALASDMLRLTFPYIFFISLTAFAGGVLNSFGRFAVPAFTPVLLNLSLIGCALVLAPRLEHPILALAWGVLVAGLAQLLLQVPSLMRLGLLPRPRLDRAHAGVQQILRLMLPALFGSSAAQLNLLINTVIASLLVQSSISWLYYSDRFVEFPLALFGVAIATVILPKLSREYSNHTEGDFNATLDWALRLSVLLALPAMAGLMSLAVPILATVINYGKLTLHDVSMSALSLTAYALGLPAFILVKVLAPGFYSRQDTETPVKIGLVAIGANMALNALIVLPWYLAGVAGPHAGLALASALAGCVNAGLLLRQLRKQGIYTPLPGWTAHLLRVTASAALMAVTIVLLRPGLNAWDGAPAHERILWLAGLVAAGAAVYTACLLALGFRPRRMLASR